ncbi:MAG: XdhC/CoxI family protein [Candidatus Sericytochromatia bacterium]|nr:XdhC/CoxI family protein [Candidatus Sericytochromatia bacterium]
MRNEPIMARLTEALVAGAPVALATVTGITGSIPTEVGAKLLVNAAGQILAGTVGGGALEAVVIHRLMRAIHERKALELEHHLTDDEASTLGMTCGGSIRLFLEPYVAHPRLLLVGAGHVNQAVARMAQDLDFDVWVVDDRPQWVTTEFFPRAQRLEVVSSLKRPFDFVDHSEDVFLVIATRCHATDRLVLREAIQRTWRYVGMIGSRHKIVSIREELQGENLLEAISSDFYAPMGLDLGGKSPASVALSILSEIQMLRHGRNGRSLSESLRGEVLPAGSENSAVSRES